MVQKRKPNVNYLLPRTVHGNEIFALTFQGQIRHLHLLKNAANLKLSGVYYDMALLGINANWDMSQV